MPDFSRRTVVRGAAWSVPVIAVAAPISAFATSCQTFSFGASSCKCAGNSDADVKGYNLTICFNCPPGQTPPPGTSPTNLTIVAVSKNSGPMFVTPRAGACNNTLPQQVDVGDCTTLIHFNSTDSATPLFVDYYFTGDPNQTIFQVRVDAPPDCVDCSLPVYCCTDANEPFPARHECPV
jgi:hypothetical protein